MSFPAVYFKADWSESHFLSTLSFPFTSLSFRLKTYRLYLAYTCEEALGSKVTKMLPLREREAAAAQKDSSATVVASVRSTGAAVVGGVNATEFWQR